MSESIKPKEDQIVKCTQCDNVHKFSSRLQHFDGFMTCYYCPYCLEESYTLYGGSEPMAKIKIKKP